MHKTQLSDETTWPIEQQFQLVSYGVRCRVDYESMQSKWQLKIGGDTTRLQANGNQAEGFHLEHETMKY